MSRGIGAAFEIVGRADDRQAQTRIDPHRDHALAQALAKADPGIKPFLDDVDQPVGRDDLHFEIGVGTYQRPSTGPSTKGAIELGTLIRTLPKGVSRNWLSAVDGRTDVVESRRELRQQHRSGIGQRHAAGRAVQQADADAGLKVADRMADRRRRDATLLARPAEAAVPRDRVEGGEFGEIGRAH